MLGFWVCLAFLFPRADFTQQGTDLPGTHFTRLYHKSGNISFVGIFKHRFGPNCSLEIGRGLEEIASTIWTVEALNKYQYLSGFSVGVSVFGICENLSDQEDILRGLEEHLRSDEDANYFGILTSPEISNNLPIPEGFLGGNLQHVEHVINIDIITDATVQVLINLQWMNVNRVIADSEGTLKAFKEKALEEGLFVQDELLMNDRDSCNRSSEFEISSVTVVLGAFANISTLTEKLCEGNTTLILTPTDFVFDVSLLDLEQKITAVSLPPIGNRTALSGYVKSAQSQKDFFSQKPPAKGPLFLGTAASVLKLLKPIKKAVEEHCQNKHAELPCAPIGDFMEGVLGNKTRLQREKSMKTSPDDVEEALKVLKIEPSSNDEMFLYITSVVNGNASEDLAIFQIFSLAAKKFQPILLMINDFLLADGDSTGRSQRKINYLKKNNELEVGGMRRGDPVVDSLHKYPGNSEEQSETTTVTLLKKTCENQDGQNLQACLNLTGAINHTTANPHPTWRYLTWVSINTSLGFVGVTCTLSTMLFVLIRLCKDDIPESSPCFVLLLMISVVITYFSSMPFHFEFLPDGRFICSYRANVPPAVFAILFSLLLSRSIVIAFRESEGEFVTHINGYLQFILCFFMIGVQVSIIFQNWIISGDDSEINCAEVYNKYKIIFSLGYDFLLLILLACVSPFTIRSKQNYKEGLLFSISVFFITVVWSAWISFYVLLPNEQKDAAVAIGLNSTASVLLFCVFIPQTYLKAAPFAHDRTLRSLSPLDGNILRDVHFKSDQTLTESAFGTITYKNCEMGLSNPNFCTGRSNCTNNPSTRETVIEDSPETPN